MHISTNFNGEGYFVLNGTSDVKEMEILVGDVTKTSKDKIIFKSNISLGNVKQNIQLNFIDESNRSWFVYAKKLNKNESSVCKEVLYWNSLQYTWKKQIFLNYLLSIKSLKLKKLAFLDDSYGLEFIICDILINETVEPEVDFDNFNNWLAEKISNINENEINELFDIKEIILQGINSLKPLELFPNLRLVYLDNCEIKDINSLNNLNYLSFYESPEYPTNNPSLYQNPEYFSKQVNIISNAFDFIEKYFYDEFYVRWESTICSKLYNPSVTLLLLKEKGLSDLFESKVRHYTLENHTILVCNVFEKYFTDKQSFGISIGLFRTLLLLHDIGKPEAFTKGNKDNQYKFTQNIIKKVWCYLPYSFAELQIILALLEGDYLGYYFQNGSEKEKLSDKLHSLSKSCGLDTIIFFRIYMIYYQCDIASYTADAGGIKFLEHLFEYRNGEKVFDKEEGILKMSPKYWEMYKQLKNEIENGN